jgi:hypothetical protein
MNHRRPKHREIGDERHITNIEMFEQLTKFVDLLVNAVFKVCPMVIARPAAS